MIKGMTRAEYMRQYRANELPYQREKRLEAQRDSERRRREKRKMEKQKQEVSQ